MPANGVGTGKNAHGWADALGLCEGIRLIVGGPLHASAQKLMDSLGVEVVIEPGAPMPPLARVGKTRRELDPATIERQRLAFAARPEPMRKPTAAEKRVAASLEHAPDDALTANARHWLAGRGVA